MKVAAIIFAQTLVPTGVKQTELSLQERRCQEHQMGLISLGVLDKVGLFLNCGQEATLSRCYI